MGGYCECVVIGDWEGWFSIEKSTVNVNKYKLNDYWFTKILH